MKPTQIAAAWKGLAACRSCGIRHLALFADLEEADFAHIHLPIEEMRFDAGSEIYAVDTAATAIFTVRQGLAKLLHVQPDGTQRIVRLVRTGGVAGIEALVRRQYEHTAIALQPLEVCRIPLAVVTTLQDRTPRLHRRLMEKWYEALSSADDMLTELSTGSARRRMARLLLRLSEDAPDAPVRLFAREDIGALLGVTLETASRSVSEFKRLGAIREVAHNLVACDRVALTTIAEEG